MSNNTDYRMVRFVDGSTLMGTITVDKDFIRIIPNFGTIPLFKGSFVSIEIVLKFRIRINISI